MISLAWYQKPELAIMKMAGKLSTEDVLRATDILYDWFDNSGLEKVHLIVDQLELEQLPSISSLTKVKVSPRRGWIILVAQPNKPLEFASSVASQILKMKVKTVRDMTEALFIIRKFVPELADLQELSEIPWEEEIQV